jgi:amino acid permease
MIELFTILMLFVEAALFIVYGIIVIFEISRRKKYTISVDNKMLNIGRIFSWGGVIGISVISKKLSLGAESYLVFATLLMIIFIFGSRLYVNSFKVKEENKSTFYYEFDQRLVRIYKKYLEPLWK